MKLNKDQILSCKEFYDLLFSICSEDMGPLDNIRTIEYITDEAFEGGPFDKKRKDSTLLIKYTFDSLNVKTYQLIKILDKYNNSPEHYRKVMEYIPLMIRNGKIDKVLCQ